MSQSSTPSSVFDPLEHYKRNVGPTTEFGALPQTQPTLKNIGWTLGNDCPYKCTHCYSMNAREKGQDLSVAMIDRIIEQLVDVGVETVNLGGNEPLFTNGANPRRTLLPYIIERLSAAKILVGLTTSGITAVWLHRHHRASFRLLNDCDVSLDSPFEDEHNANRGAKIYGQALEALDLCESEKIPHTCILAAMNWNFTSRHIDALVEIAIKHQANVRINPIKPTQPSMMAVALPPDMYFRGFRQLLNLCEPLDLGEPPLAGAAQFQDARRCPCGRTSFRIHSITPDGAVYVSPCVYLHDYKSALDLLHTDLRDIIASPQFVAFRQRNRNPEVIEGCAGCDLLSQCGGGCTARAYLSEFNTTGRRTLLARDPYCPKANPTSAEVPPVPGLRKVERLVHMDYLCTWIGRPRMLCEPRTA